MKRFHTALLAACAVLLSLTGCNKKPAPFGDFDNKVYIDQNTSVTTLLVGHDRRAFVPRGDPQTGRA